MNTPILGISSYYHDSAAALLIDGEIVAAAQEERFTRIKHDASFPHHAIAYVLKESGLDGSELSLVAFYEKPFLKFERLLETYHAFAPRGLRSFIKAMPVWMKEKLYMKQLLRKELLKHNITPSELLFPEHHLSHAAAAFYPSPFERAAILTVDGVGEWATTTICLGEGENITLLKELCFPHSLGLLYSAFTYYCGFRVNSGEYKLMGLAPYGMPSERVNEYIRKIKTHLIDIREDGSFLLNMDYFRYATGLEMTRDCAWEKLFQLPRREPENGLSQEYMDLAFAIQQVTEEVLLRLAGTAKQLTGCRYLALAGGVALNCVANGKILKSGLFEDLWIQPAAGDAGGALGAALAVWHIHRKEARVTEKPDKMSGAYLGPSFTGVEVQHFIRNTQAEATRLPGEELYTKVAALLNEGQIVGWFQGRMEFGPRALGNRSILADPRNTGMQKRLNMEIKFRESFRPFAPSVLEEDAALYVDLPGPSPYMLLVGEVLPGLRLPLPEGYGHFSYTDKLYQSRSLLQAVTHVDFSARVQTVSKEANPAFYALLCAFKALTGYGVLVNTSFNVRGEPVVCSPADAYRCFMATGMDYLVIGDWLFEKR
jgi:carbamoyltransferase